MPLPIKVVHPAWNTPEVKQQVLETCIKSAWHAIHAYPPGQKIPPLPTLHRIYVEVPYVNIDRYGSGWGSAAGIMSVKYITTDQRFDRTQHFSVELADFTHNCGMRSISRMNGWSQNASLAKLWMHTVEDYIRSFMFSAIIGSDFTNGGVYTMVTQHGQGWPIHKDFVQNQRSQHQLSFFWKDIRDLPMTDWSKFPTLETVDALPTPDA